MLRVAEKLGLDTDDSIVQTNVVGHTGADGFSRLLRQAQFDGDVLKGRNFLRVDDFIGQGRTIINLRGYIEKHCGKVIGAVVLTGKPFLATLTSHVDRLQELREKHGNLEPWWRKEFGFGFDRRTASEARHLLRTEDADKIRDRVLAAKQKNDGSESQASAEEVSSSSRLGAGYSGAGENDIQSSNR